MDLSLLLFHMCFVDDCIASVNPEILDHDAALHVQFHGLSDIQLLSPGFQILVHLSTACSMEQVQAQPSLGLLPLAWCLRSMES